jgi:hypothetical protein
VIVKNFPEAGYEMYTGENPPIAEHFSKDEKLDRNLIKLPEQYKEIVSVSKKQAETLHLLFAYVKKH